MNLENTTRLLNNRQTGYDIYYTSFYKDLFNLNILNE